MPRCLASIVSQRWSDTRIPPLFAMAAWLWAILLWGCFESTEQRTALEPEPAASSPLVFSTDIPCSVHCDCPQGHFCYYGKCLHNPDEPVYCCSNADGTQKTGCKPGAWCIEPSGERGACTENATYSCQTACDCGPGYACLDVPGVGRTCVMDADDPWRPSSSPSIFGVVVPPDAPTYCCADPICHAGSAAAGEQGLGFSCWDTIASVQRDYCGGTPCYSDKDCRDIGESCADTRSGLSGPGLCRQEGGFCVSNAALEAVYGWSSAEMLPMCGPGIFPGQTCTVGWKPGGTHVVERVTGVGGSCGNAKCELWESPVTCSADCSCGDGVCSGTEILAGSCSADCGTCGDLVCTAPETPKTCPSDCQLSLGDGSCSSLEIGTADCACPGSPSLSDYPALCGDGVCQKGGHIPEDCVNCPRDCPANTDADGDGTADGCDLCPLDPLDDVDDDGVCGNVDNCPSVPGSQDDHDSDGAGDVCDPDDDGDGQSDAYEIVCGSDPFDGSSLSPDSDTDGLPNCVDDDDDNDGVRDVTDNCPLILNADQLDYDSDGAGDVCDLDDDNDGVLDEADAIPRSGLGATVVLGSQDSGVSNRVLGTGARLGDLLANCAAQSTGPGEYLTCVNSLVMQWQSDGVLTRVEGAAIRTAAARSGLFKDK